MNTPIPQNCPNRVAPPLSLRQLTRHTLVRMSLVILTMAVLLVLVIGHYIERDQINEVEAQRILVAEDLSLLLKFYQRVVDEMARQSSVRDLINFADVEGAQAWAQALRPLLPDSIGLALVRMEGEVLGEPLELRLGPGCLRDLDLNLRDLLRGID